MPVHVYMQIHIINKTKTNLILIKTNDCVQKYIHFSMNRDMVKVIDITKYNKDIQIKQITDI